MRKRDAAALLLFVALSVVMTWPLAPNLGRAVSDPGDPYINTWILDWVSHALTHDPSRLFHANAFHPAKYSLAFSENLVLVGALLTPFRLLGLTPLAAHNVAMLAGLAFSGFGAFLLARFLTGSTSAAVASGVFYAFLPFRFTHLPQVQHAFAGWLPVLLLALLLYVRTPGRRAAAWFALALVGTALTNVHWFFFGATAAAATVAVTAMAGERRWWPLAIATAVAAAVVLPFFYPYFVVQKLYGMERQWSEVSRHSAVIGDWLVSGFHTRLYASLTNATTDPERWLFPGALGIVLTIAGVVAARRQRYILVVALLWIAIGVWGSLGVNGAFHSFLFDSVPGFRAIRAPARWAGVAYCGMAVLIAHAAAAIDRKSRIAAAVLSLAFLIELRAAPIRWYIENRPTGEVYRWLAKSESRGAVLELPMASGGSEYRYLLAATAHHKPIVNGISGFAPRHFTEVAAMANATPIPDGFVPRLMELGCDRIVVHTDWLGERHAPTAEFLRRETARGRLVRERRFDAGLAGDTVYRLVHAGKPVPDLRPLELEPSRQTFGRIDSPAPGAVVWGPLTVSGFAFSPHGIRAVDLVFNNSAIRIPATLIPDGALTRRFPWYPATAKPRFTLTVDRKPDAVWSDTDIYAEVVDGRGEVTRLESRWFAWRSEPGEWGSEKGKVKGKR